MYQIRKSDDQDFYYLLEIDDKDNETLIEENHDLVALQQNEKIKDLKLVPVLESTTRDVSL